MRQKRSTKILSLLLSLTMVLGMFTGNLAFAAEKDVKDSTTSFLSKTSTEGETRTYVLHPSGLTKGMSVVVPIGETAVVSWEWDQEENGYIPHINGVKMRDDLTFDAEAIAPIVCNPLSDDGKQVVGGLQKIRSVPDQEYVLAPTEETTDEELDILVGRHSPDVPYTIQYIDQDGVLVKEVEKVATLFDDEFFVSSSMKDLKDLEDIDEIEILRPTYTTINVTKDEYGNNVAIPDVVQFNVKVTRYSATRDITIRYMMGNTEVGTGTVTLNRGDPTVTIHAENPPEGYYFSPEDQSYKAEYTDDGKIKIDGRVVTGDPVITFTVKKTPPPKAYYDIVVNGEKAFTLGIGEGTSATLQWKKYQPPYVDGYPQKPAYNRLELVTGGKTYYPETVTDSDGTETNGFKSHEIVLNGKNIDVTGAYNMPQEVRDVPLDSTIEPMVIDLTTEKGDAEKYPKSAPKQMAVTITNQVPVVTGVKISHPNEKNEKGTTEHFTATVEGEHVSQEVTWSVIGTKHSSIDADGVLTVPEEEPYDIFRVRATSVDDPTKYAEVEVRLVPAGMPQGAGTEEDPYIITTAKELNAMRELSSTYSPEYFKIANDIDLSEYADTWTPIGDDYNQEFGGIVDGNGKTIRGLNVDQADGKYVGLFGYLRNSTIKNLTVEVEKVNGRTYMGGLAGYANDSIIDHCAVRAASEDSIISGSSNAGGLVGTALGTTVTNSYAEVDVKAAKLVAGLIGSFSGDTSVYVENCYATGDVTSTNTDLNTHIHAGGLIGNAQKADIRNCFATGDITATGIRIGGLTATLAAATKGVGIENSYASGTIHAGEGSTWVGGLVGSLQSSAVLKNTYYNSECGVEAGCGTVSSGLEDTSVGKTEAELKSRDFALLLNANTASESSWAKWGFDANVNNSYPVLTGIGVGTDVDEVTEEDQYVHYNVMLDNVGGLLQTNFEIDVKVGDTLQLGYEYAVTADSRDDFGYWLTINGKKVSPNKNNGKFYFEYNGETIQVGANIGCITSKLPPENPPALVPTEDMVGETQNVIMPLRDFTQNVITIPIVAGNWYDEQVGSFTFEVDHYTKSDRFQVSKLTQSNIDVTMNEGYTIEDCVPESSMGYAVVMGADGVARLGTTSPALNQFRVEVTKEETVTFKSAGNGFLNDLTNAQTPVIETGAIGSEVPVPTTRPASGCEFVYWTNSEGEKVELGETVKVPLGGETYTAHFAKVKYTVRFEITDPKYGTLVAKGSGSTQVDPQTVEATGYDYNTASYPEVKPADGYTWSGWRDKNDPDGEIHKWVGTFQFRENITYEAVIVPENHIDIQYQFVAPGVEKPILKYSGKLFLNEPKNFITEKTIENLAKKGYRLEPAEQANWEVLYSDVGVITLNGEPVEWQGQDTLITYTVVPTAPQSLTVSYGKNVKLEVNGVSQPIADLIGKYQLDEVESGTAFTFTFTPRVDGQAFRSVQIGDAEPILISGTSYTYEFEMPVTETNLSFTFEMTDKTTLQQVYDYAKTYVEDGTVDKLIESVKTAFMEAYNHAKTVLDDPAATQTDINEAWVRLLDMIHYLEFTPGDKADLLELLKIANSLNSEDYTASSWDALVKMRTAAQSVADDAEALENDIQKARDNLYNALMALVYAANRSQLDLLIAEAEEILPQLESKYRPDGQEEFKAALQAAKDLTDEATQSEVDQAALRLSNAIAALRLIPNRDELKALIDEVKRLDMSDYTATSASACLAALHIAENAYNNAQATPKEIMEAFDLLEDTKANLKINNNHNSSSGSSSSGGKGGSSSGSTGGTAIAATSPVVNAAQNVTVQASVRSDTTLPFTLKRGSAYCFKMTVTNGSTAMPSFTVGNGSVLKTQFVAKSGNDYYFRVWAIGTPGQQTGVYTQMPGENPQFHCAVTIG